ncbi:ABC transporter permease [Mucilaginibacter rubeus]|uniref:FtsX-like permease family protein n=1 Tax=Mucilaginibacter rubeus TaxID=2027860 RepID=A0A5C1I2W2_9SPHI|nr:ABC transporter permease [Mucilaginibacter rubeus]QEM12104.1 FtsX-like permease family protein [Mucilaginibacter rubeus]
MIRNYFKTAFRSLLKNKGFTFINILGLALGLAICLLITFYVVDELSYDRYNTKHERVYRVNTDLKFSGTLTEYAITAIPVANVLKTECPEVETAVRITPALNIRFKKGDEIVREDGSTFYSEPNIFDVFTLPLLSGDAKTALKEPNTVVIAESMAQKYFNRVNVVGQTLFLVTSSTPLKITGVMKDMPVQSHFRANFLLSAGPVSNDAPWNRLTAFATYVLLKPNSNVPRLESKLNAVMKEGLKGSSTMNYSKFTAGGNYFKLSLMPVTDIHLKSNRVMELGANGNSQYVYIFAAVAIFILLLACINFMNLSTARSANRAREVGVRKVLGSSRSHLIFQFLAESLIVTFAAAVIAILAAWALLPLFNHLSNKQLAINAQTATWILPALLSIVIIVGILAGSYPAFFLSAFQPINVLKGKISTGFKGGAFRSTLVVFQFSISIFLVIGTLVIYNQLNYIQNKDLGFNRNQVLILNNVNTLEHPELLKQEIKKLPGVVNATLTSFLPTANNKVLNYVSPGEKQEGQSTQFWKIDEDYIGTMGMQMKTGRGFSGEFRTDSTAMVINETAAKVFGYGDNANGKTITTGTAKDLKKYHVIGVVKDFNFSSLRDNVTPLVMTLDNDWLARLSIRVNTHNLPALMAGIEKTWKTIAPNEHFDYSFMDADFDALYRTEQRMGQLFITFTGLAIVIACLGLFGLAAYAAEQRNREIGIRKVLGASITAIVTMLSKDFVKLVIISFAIAAPLAWLTMNKWLQGFAYRQNIQWWMVILAGSGAILIAFATISLQSFRAAAANPVQSLRDGD